MTRKERATIVKEELDKLYPAPQVPLEHSNAYTLLVAVVLSAQCTDIRVNTVTPKLFALARTPERMAEQNVSSIQEIIRPCGLSERKATAIHELSRIITEKHKGEVPSTLEELEALPGVGHKTASVVMVQAFDTPAFPVDTHIHRLAARWKLSDGKNVVKTEKDLKKLFPKESWAKLHLQIIHYGREHCTARGCDGHKCLICTLLNGEK